MTLSQTDRAGMPKLILQVADVDEYGEAVYCPVCGHRLERVGTPSVPGRVLEGYHDVGTIRALAYECSRHRVDRVVLVVPAQLGPDTYESVPAEIDGEELEVAVPEPVYNEAVVA